MELLLYIILFFFIYWGIRGAIKLFVIFKQIHKVKSNSTISTNSGTATTHSATMPKADSETALLVADSGAALTQATATAKPLAMPVPHAATPLRLAT